MNKYIYNRCINEAFFMIKTNKTIRELVPIFNVSKSTIHKDLTDRLFNINKKLYVDISNILNYHNNIKHVHGGASTKLKYLLIKQKN